MVTAYRIAVASREECDEPPPWDDSRWLRIVHTRGSGLANRRSPGVRNRTREQAIHEAWLWRDIWHVRLVRVVRR